MVVILANFRDPPGAKLNVAPRIAGLPANGVAAVDMGGL